MLASISVAQHAREGSTRQATYESATHGPTLQYRGIHNAKVFFIEELGSADHDPVIAKEQSSHRRDQRNRKEVSCICMFHAVLSFSLGGIFDFSSTPTRRVLCKSRLHRVS